MISRILAAAAEEGGTPPNPLLPADYDILWSSVVFVILLTLFWVKVLPGFKKMLDEARTAAVEAEQEKLRAESSEIREVARAEGAAILSDMKAQAAAEAERLSQVAKSQLEAERDAAVNALRNEIGGLALELASRIVGAKLQDDQVANKVVDDFIAELEGKKA
jgi:F-type H+-transporting ATPase subunit b